MTIELSRNLNSLWYELSIKKEDYTNTEKDIKKLIKNIKKYDETYIERIGDKKLQVVFTNEQDLFGTCYKIDMNTNHVVKNRYGFTVMEYDWKGKINKIIEKIVIMESEE